MLHGAPAALGRAGGFRRTLVSVLDGRTATPRTLWCATEPDPPLPPAFPLRYPLVEAEVADGGADAFVVDVDDVGRRSPAVLREHFRWERYVVAVVRLGGRPVGLLHAEPAGPREADEGARAVAGAFASGFASVFELAALRDALQARQDAQWTVVRSMGARLERAAGDSAPRSPAVAAASRDPLTAREREVLELVGRGLTNHAIADRLTLSEGTVKFHVRNVLRKLRATSRADAVARHLQARA